MTCVVEILVGVLVAILTIIAVHYVYLLWNSDYWKKRGVFCPDSKLLFGNLPGQVDAKRHIQYDLADLYERYKNEYPYIGIFNFRQPRFLLFDPEIIKDILVKYFKHFQGNEFTNLVDAKSDPLFGNHPFVLVGEAWKKKRGEISPAFTSSRIKAMFPIMQDVNEKMIKYIKNEISKPDFDGFDVKDLSARYTISVVSNSIYNVDPKSFEGGESEILKISQRFTAPTKKFTIAQMLLTVYPFLDKWVKVGFSQPGAVDFFVDLMKNAIKHREESKEVRSDYLDYLMSLRNKKQITDADMASHGASFLVDGFDTSSSGISSALYELGKNKTVQNRLRKEIMLAMPKEEDFTYDNIVALDYLDQIFNETLRLHSPGIYLTKLCNEPVEVDLPKDKKLFFKKNSIIYIPLIAIHLDPEYYENPLQFDPDRFAPELGGAKQYADRGVFMPFGYGPRICVGQRFAISQSKVAIATIIRNFEISINRKTPQKFILHPQAMINTLSECYLDLKEVEHAE